MKYPTALFVFSLISLAILFGLAIDGLDYFMEFMLVYFIGAFIILTYGAFEIYNKINHPTPTIILPKHLIKDYQEGFKQYMKDKQKGILQKRYCKYE